jgi:hypothetical protein
MSTYENAPATKLLATHCACCGRALVDAVSVETGIGPECRKRFVVRLDVTQAAHDEANQIVFALARSGLSRAAAQPMFDRLHALGFVVLAERVAKRFRAKVTQGPTVEMLRDAYRKIRADYCYDNVSPKEIDALAARVVATMPGGPTPQNFVDALERITCKCRRCAGTGSYVTGTLNGRPTGPGGDCFRCGGTGEQDLVDARRNRAYDAYAAAEALRRA